MANSEEALQGRYEAVRGSWLIQNQENIQMQRRRGDELLKRSRALLREQHSTGPASHAESITPSIWKRKGSWQKALLVATFVALPIGWPLGWAAWRAMELAVPDRFSRYPWRECLAAGLVAALLLLVTPLPHTDTAYGAIAAWAIVQAAATPTVAGVYGLLNGWNAAPEDPARVLRRAIKRKGR
jgi:hypothetical protein